jgi:hypothetical protein
LKQLLVLCAAAALSGCFIWYKPVPVANAIGEEMTLLAGDSVNVYRSDRFEVYGPGSEAVYDGYEQLNRAVRSFERHFGTRAPKLAVVLFRDTVERLSPEATRAIRDRGFTVVSYARPRVVRRRSYRLLDYGGVSWPIAPVAAREMLRVFAEGRVNGARDADVLDRFPVWYRAAVMHLVGDAGTIANDIEFVRETRGAWQPFKTLLTLAVPASGDSLLDPVRRNDAPEYLRMVAAQSSTFGRYLVEREGPAVIGRIGTGYLSGKSLSEMIAGFHTAPRNLDDLESRWKGWVETREVDY